MSEAEWRFWCWGGSGRRIVEETHNEQNKGWLCHEQGRRYQIQLLAPLSQGNCVYDGGAVMWAVCFASSAWGFNWAGFFWTLVARIRWRNCRRPPSTIDHRQAGRQNTESCECLRRNSAVTDRKRGVDNGCVLVAVRIFNLVVHN